MRLVYDQWEFDLDYEETVFLSKTELADNCTCDFCRNFYQCVRENYPALERFLNSFGLELFAPSSLEPYPYSNSVDCAMEYMALGKVLKTGDAPVVVDHIQITFQEENGVIYLMFNLLLPWTLDLPIEQARLATGECVQLGFWNNTDFIS